MDISGIARELGRRGGQARARALAAPDRKRIAAIGGRARRQSLEAARRIVDNFRYVDTVRHLAPPPPVARRKTCRGPLPGLYRRK